MNLLIIGNGFDLNLGFKTSYKDFMNSTFFHQLCGPGENEIARNLRGKANVQKWIDVEIELARISHRYKQAGYNGQFTEKVKNDYKALSNALISYLHSLDFSEFDKDSDAYKLIRSIDSDVIIIDFNYTPALEYILKETCKKHYVNSHIKIHGTIENSGIVLGVSDDADIHPEHIFLKKGYSPNLVSFDFEDNFSIARRVTFFGYSLGDMDHTYFKKFFSSSCKSLYSFRICLNNGIQFSLEGLSVRAI